MKLNIAILGTRGIPNKYGGFEQCAEHLSKELVGRGHDVTVYNAHWHPHQESNFQRVNIIHKWCPEHRLGSAAHFVYDYICLRDAIKQGFDVILELGYGTSAISYCLLDLQGAILVTNMDGLEWKRAKWGRTTQKMTRWFEKLGAKKSDYLVSDNFGIKEHLQKTYDVISTLIPYGAEVFNDPDANVLDQHDLSKGGYYLLIARLEPENHVETILDGFVASNSGDTFLVVGNYETKYGRYLRKKYDDTAIKFIGSIYDKKILDSLRYYSKMYFHGHSVGGTNPSLLEAMAAQAWICAHNNVFNKNVLQEKALYFDKKEDIVSYINNYSEYVSRKEQMIKGNMEIIRSYYSWDNVTEKYEKLFIELVDDSPSVSN